MDELEAKVIEQQDCHGSCKATPPSKATRDFVAF